MSMRICVMFKKLLKKSVHSGVISELRQPLLDRKDYEISCVVTKSNQLLQDRTEYGISNVIVNSNEPFQYRDGCEISKEIAPVAHLSPTGVKVGNVSGGVLQDASEGELRDWCNLPDVPLLSILERLTSLGDFFAFSHVCREWRFVSEVRKREYMATQPPLVCANLSYGGFYSWKEERLYKGELLKVRGERIAGFEKIAGFSHGFFISLRFKYGETYFSLVNPVTGVEVMARFPVTPKCVSTLNIHASLNSSPTSPDCMLLFSDGKFICLSRLGDLEWAIHKRDDDEGGEILCVIFFKGKIYALNAEGHILIYDQFPHPKFTFCRARNNPFKFKQSLIYRRGMWLVDCGGELFAIQYIGGIDDVKEGKFVVRRFDFTTCKWVRLKNLGNHALFLDSEGGAFWDDATKWGGSGNCIYYLSNRSDERKFHVFHMEDGRVEEISFPGRFCSFCWVFLRLC